MKTKKYIAIGLSALALSFSSCEDYLDINESPNQAPDAPVSNVMTAAMVSVMNGHSGEDARLAGMWTQQFTGADRQYAAFDVYNITAADFDWGKYYFGTVDQAEVIIKKSTASGNTFDLGIAQLLKAHAYGMMASLWGNIPFSEANKFEQGIDNPKFDGQKSVYAGVQGLLDDAINNLQAGIGSTPAADLFYGGDATKWIQLANTLKARFYMHTKQYGLALTAAQNGITSSADNWLTVHTQGAYNQDQNMYYSFGVSDRDGYMTADGAYLPSILDPASASYRGNSKTDETARYNDLYEFDATNNSLILNYSGMWSATSPFPLATAVENHLIMAEVNARNGADLAAVGNLNDARAELRATYSSGTYDDYLFTDFLPGGIADEGQGSQIANLLYEIVEEKYASLVGQIEAFNDVRRTDNLIGLTPKGSNNSLPQRYIYPTDELNANTNAPDAVGLFVETEVNK